MRKSWDKFAFLALLCAAWCEYNFTCLTLLPLLPPPYNVKNQYLAISPDLKIVFGGGGGVGNAYKRIAAFVTNF